MLVELRRKFFPEQIFIDMHIVLLIALARFLRTSIHLCYLPLRYLHKRGKVVPHNTFLTPLFAISGDVPYPLVV